MSENRILSKEKMTPVENSARRNRRRQDQPFKKRSQDLTQEGFLLAGREGKLIIHLMENCLLIKNGRSRALLLKNLELIYECKLVLTGFSKDTIQRKLYSIFYCIRLKLYSISDNSLLVV